MDSHDEVNISFSQFRWTRLKKSELKIVTQMPVFETLGNVNR